MRQTKPLLVLNTYVKACAGKYSMKILKHTKNILTMLSHSWLLTDWHFHFISDYSVKINDTIQ